MRLPYCIRILFRPQSKWHRVPRWRMAIIDAVAAILGVSVKVGGLPYGSWRNKNWEDPGEMVCSGSVGPTGIEGQVGPFKVYTESHD
jgi:hypothetical protein